MQPDSDKDQWQQPADRGSAAPYTPVLDDSEEDQTSRTTSGPVITLSPEENTQASPEEDFATEPAETGKGFDDESPLVHWQAQEYIHREKDVIWYVTFAVVVVALMALALFLMKSLTFVILIPVMAAALAVYASRPPRMIDYTLSRQGVHFNDHLYPFGEYKGFSVIHGDDEYSIMLIPIKRFKPGVTIYFPEDKGEAIVDVLAARLPMEESHLDFIDQLIKKLRI